MRRLGLSAVTAAMVALAAPAQAETIEDYLRMDCGDFMALPLETQVAVLFWLDGWFSRDDGHMQLDFEDVAYAIRGIEDACIENSRLTLERYFDVRL